MKESHPEPPRERDDSGQPPRREDGDGAPTVIGRVEPVRRIVSAIPASGSIQKSTVPCYRDELERIESMLVENRSLALLYVDAKNLAAIEHDYGATIYDQVRDILTNLIVDMQGVETRRDDVVTVDEVHGDTFLIFLSKKREESPFGRASLRDINIDVLQVVDTDTA